MSLAFLVSELFRRRRRPAAVMLLPVVVIAWVRLRLPMRRMNRAQRRALQRPRLWVLG